LSAAGTGQRASTDKGREKLFCLGSVGSYRLLKAQNLITSPAFVVMKAADEFKDKTTAPNQSAGAGFYLSHDPGRLLPPTSSPGKLCTTMKTEDGHEYAGVWL